MCVWSGMLTFTGRWISINNRRFTSHDQFRGWLSLTCLAPHLCEWVAAEDIIMARPYSHWARLSTLDGALLSVVEREHQTDQHKHTDSNAFDRGSTLVSGCTRTLLYDIRTMISIRHAAHEYLLMTFEISQPNRGVCCSCVCVCAWPRALALTTLLPNCRYVRKLIARAQNACAAFNCLKWSVSGCVCWTNLWGRNKSLVDDEDALRQFPHHMIGNSTDDSLNYYQGTNAFYNVRV